MTTNQMVQFLRLNLNIPDSDNLDPDTIYDPLLLQMTDEELLLYLNIALSQDKFSSADLTQSLPSLNTVPQSQVYEIILYAKKELYFSLATRSAPQVDLGADNNNYLKRDQRFKHYMDLIAGIDKELDRRATDDEDGGGGTGGVVTTYNTLVTERYHTPYNYRVGTVPTIAVNANALINSIEISWVTSYLSKFYNYKVWVSESPILDMFEERDKKISKDAKLVSVINDPHQNLCRITDLKAGTYYICVSVSEMSGLTGYNQIIVEIEPHIIKIDVVGEDGYTPVEIPEEGQILTANVTVFDGVEETVIGSYPVNTDIKYEWFYKDSLNILGTEPVYTVTSDNIGKIICVRVSSLIYADTLMWSASGGVI